MNRVQAEARHIVRIFSDPNRQFSLVPVDPDGWCMFVSVTQAVGRGWATLVKEMKTFANGYLKDAENTVSINDPQEVCACGASWIRRRQVLCNPFGRVRLLIS